MSWMDIRDMRRALSSTSPLSLDYMASLYDDCEAWKQKDEDGEEKVIFTRDDQKLKIYNARDCVETSRVYEGLLAESEWHTPRVQRLYEVHSQLSVIAAEMHTTGIYVNKRERAFIHHCLNQEIAEKEALFLKMVGIPGMRCTPNDLRALIYRRHANKRVSRFNLDDPADPRMYTDEELMATISVDTDSLLMLMTGGDCPDELIPIIDAYWEAESAKKRRSFVKSEAVDRAIGQDGRLRPGWNSCGTDTMRFSCSEPNVMNIEQELRAMYGPAPGKVLVHADKSQLELRVMAAVADDDVLQDNLNTGDVYSQDAKAWFHLPADMDVKKLKPAARKSSKIIHLAAQYAASLPTVHGQALREDRKMKFNLTALLFKAFRKTYCRTVEYWHEEQQRVLKCGYSEGRILNGRRVYPRPPTINEIANYPIQRSAGEMMNLELIELHGRLRRHVPTARIIIQLHDAFDVEGREKDERVITDIMTDVMSRDYTIDGRTRSFPVEIKVARYSAGQTWADV